MSFPASSSAGGYLVEDVAMVPLAPQAVVLVAPAPGLTYQDWLLRRHPPGGIIYNRPCTVSDGVREHGVPCEAVAAALSGPYIPGVYPVELPALAYIVDEPCFYPDGWNGPGYYRRGFAWNRGYGWSGRHLSGARHAAGFGRARFHGGGRVASRSNWHRR
ncbi:MAG: hypothetical protein WA733_10770 [Methylocystis sp.]